MSQRRETLETSVNPWLRPLLLLIVPLIFLLTTVPTGFLLESPGPSFGLQEDLLVQGAQTYPSNGEFLLTAIRLQESRLISHLVSLFDDNYDNIKSRDYLGEDLDAGEQELVDEAVTLLSQNSAVAVALEEAGKQVQVMGLGGLVVFVGEDYPAYGVLEPGDIVVSVHGEPVQDTEEISEAIGSVPPGQEVELGVRRLNEEALEKASEDDDPNISDMSRFLGSRADVQVEVVSSPEQDRSIVGIAMRDYFSYESDIEVDWELESVRGPSAGLMMTLSLVNTLTPEDLTGGKAIAGTGEIFLSGEVGAIGGLPMKIKAAQREGAEIFIYPLDNQEDLKGVSTSLELYPVENLQQALEVLSGLN